MRSLRFAVRPAALTGIVVLGSLATLVAMADDGVDAADAGRRTLAFPTAEGYGRFATGGRGGDVYHVTSLADHGPGSLRRGVETTDGPRTIVFAIDGTIALESALDIRDVHGLTVAGQTAPGDGIALKGQRLHIRDSSDLIIRYIRFRLGDESRTESDVITISGAHDVILDHVTATWGVDGIMDTRGLANFTLQWSIFAEALHDSTHHKGPHAMLSSYRDTVGNVSIHHNLLASSRNRHPTLGGGSRANPSAIFDFRNNVIYNAEGYTNLAHGHFVLVGNTYRRGPNTRPDSHAIAPKAVDEDVTVGYMAGNVFDGHPKWDADNYDAVRWGVRGGSYVADVQRAEFTLAEEPVARADRPATQEADASYRAVLDHAGASLRRDSADIRLIAGVRSRTHRRIDSQADVGGWPALAAGLAPPDTDGDGMSDAWEHARGLDSDDPTDGNGDDDSDGYTNLEEYLNGLSDR
ncbi:pectate lyase [Candidatus Poribacteria bacterium]|jgi:hypothetical protein|nr:pectate lyase [Candidatus Poribacteria bacterium]MBT5532507.1 pectate lyase [Candidatus Poribacteria bacterium]MBT5711751.1 pectate lyase [Candidatus Poribacteria bacterium]MBT7100395.1 pectate lyase [Candidatus Poribacteria bacterium]MBT7808630.1 pectate lyase [Candidatus Poribacteria bacterium]